MNARAIADAIVTALNDAVAGEELSQTFTAERHYLPRFNVTKGELDDLRVVVVPGEFNLKRFERTTAQRDDQATIGVLKKITTPRDKPLATLNAELDPLIDFVEELAEFFAPDDDDPLTVGDAEVTEVAVTPYVPDHIEDPRQFTGFLVLTLEQFG